MSSKKSPELYDPTEEKLNILTHGFGWLLSVIAFPFLIIKSFCYTLLKEQASFIIFGVSMIVLYAASTLYHRATNIEKRAKLKVFDHSAIYVLIAGTYTPFCLVSLPTKLGWYIFGTVWAFAFVGIIFKLFFTGKLKHVSTAMYVFMGWLVMFFINTLLESLPETSSFYLIAGGVFYTVGAIFYSIKKIKYNHAIFHVFVLLGSACHFYAIYNLA
ncbi:PAQR family membrane homeostasis protein TrhA [Tenacibaculum sp. M341]|uniref:PAQR family membrane homeostasis protein TrhA n=1 Tax=Tenacibaculum sp. M341 TaxID=2530339 RepID=UPI00104C0144|nr:hemolysin III family protein [Tenacibaculum sp. M341]TCI85831.1 hemolysin III family protein [Tenacibaculum sp. M341]